MFFENDGSCSRKGWKYTYKGADLLQSVLDLHEIASAQETQFREERAALLRDHREDPRSHKAKELEVGLLEAAKLKEELSVYRAEFSRNPEREYHLGLGDVVFFGLNT